MKRLPLLLALLLPVGCAPRALYFHESTKVGFAADYNSSDSQPVASNFGFKRRIVAVVPAQERISADGRDRNGVNRGEALSLVSKFHVRVGSFSEGVTITNRFASGAAARMMTSASGSSASLNALLHSDSVLVQTFETGGGEVSVDKSANTAVNERIESIMRRFVPEDTSGPSGEKIRIRNGKPESDKVDRPKKKDTQKPDGGTKVNEGETSKTRIIFGPDGKPKEVPISPEKRPVTGADAEKLPAKTKIIIGPDGAPVEVPLNSAAPPKKK